MTQEFPFERIGDLYRDTILDHYRKPRNRTTFRDPDISYDEFNPICGDRVVVQLKLIDGRIAEAGFSGEGCSISQASASMLASALEGLTLDQAEALAETFRELLEGGQSMPGRRDALGDLQAMEGVRKFPVRIKCALLAWTAMEEGIEQYRAGGNS